MIRGKSCTIFSFRCFKIYGMIKSNEPKDLYLKSTTSFPSHTKIEFSEFHCIVMSNTHVRQHRNTLRKSSWCVGRNVFRGLLVPLQSLWKIWEKFLSELASGIAVHSFKQLVGFYPVEHGCVTLFSLYTLAAKKAFWLTYSKWHGHTTSNP